jgi:nucleoside-triphosphatase
VPRATRKTNLLLTGPPGCGKSTLIIRIAGRLPVKARGFTTAEIRQRGSGREGFRITTLDGRDGVLAHKNSFRSGPRVGSYRVNIEDLDAIGAAEIEAALEDPRAALVVIDEIAHMELLSDRFRAAALRALDSPKAVLGTLQVRRDPFLDAVRSRPDAIIIEMKRGALPETENRIVTALQGILR